MKFIDEVEILISSGKGGAGCVSFRREAFAPRGGPDGGDGGKGGDVTFRSTRHKNTLIDYRRLKKYSAGNGGHGEGAKKSGSGGEDLILEVPVGTLIRSEEGVILADLTETEEVVLLRGGRGGKGNAFFKSSVNQAPTHAQTGEGGEEQKIFLELKLIADVGLIGFPNAGKSTLISHLSAAKPRIADYPFTTLTPHLGVVSLSDDQSFVIADIPGLVPGAHQGVGLGTKFLKHIERTRFFVHLIDISGLSERDPFQDYLDINEELTKHDELNSEKPGYIDLSKRPQIVVFNKIDVINSERRKELEYKFEKQFGIQPLCISGVTGQGTKELINEMRKRIF